MKLYRDGLLDLEAEFRKEAAFGARLSEEPENWPQELTSELYKQLPYLSDYEVNVNLDRVDTSRGFAFGYADLANKTERPEAEHAEMDIPHLRIPIVVQERSVKPWTVYLDGEKVLPLTEERIREDLFNPGTFDISATMPRDPSLVEPLMPPTRSGAGYGGEYKMASADPQALASAVFAQSLLATAKTKTAMGANCPTKKLKPKKKMASVSLLRAIAPTMRETDVEFVIDKIASTPGVKEGLIRAGVAKELVEVLDNTKRASADERLAYLAGAVEPTVVTVHKFPGGEFLIKSANVNAVNPKSMQGEVVPPEEAGALLGQENADAMAPGQTATMVPEPIDLEEPFEAKMKPVDEFGQYTVLDAMGNKLTGWVFPQTLAWDGNFTKQPLAVFTNGSSWALQDSVAGEIIGKSTALPSEEMPVGEGVFYTTRNGNGICTAPVTVKSTMAGPDGLPKIIAVDPLGQQLQVSFVEGLSNPMRVSDVEYAFPTTWSFMRLNGQTQLQGGGQDMGGGEGIAPEPGADPNMPPPKAGGPGKQPTGTPKPPKGKSPGNVGFGVPGGQGNPPIPPPEPGPAVTGPPPAAAAGVGPPVPGDPGGAGDPNAQAAKPGGITGKKPGGAAEKKPGGEKKDKKPGDEKKSGDTKVEVNISQKAKKEKTSAVLFYNGGFHIQGGCGLDKLSADLRYDMSPIDAEFMLGLLGVDGITAKMKVAEARRKGSVKLAGLKTITLLSERYREAEKTASALARHVPDLRRDLVKEAAVLQDESTVNNLLALNFINPENLETFVAYIPELEQTSEKLAEMQLYGYLGMQQLPEGAISRAMKNLEEVLTSLKNLSETGEIEED